MRRLLVCSTILALVATGTSSALLAPTTTLSVQAPVEALSVTDRTIVYAVGRTPSACAYVEVWDPARRFRMRFGEKTVRGCEEHPSGGAGISRVAVARRRVFWVTYIGGNITDWKLWTATPSRRSPRLLAAAASDSDGPAAVVLGTGIAAGVPYAVDDSVTYVGDTGARLFRVALGSPVRMLVAGRAPRTGRVLAVLADGRVVLLSETGEVVRTDQYEPGTVAAIGLGPTGSVVQIGRDVQVGPTTVELPPGARLVDSSQDRLVYRKGRELRVRIVSTGDDRLLRAFDVRAWQAIYFSSDRWGSAWASGRTVSWSPRAAD